MRQFIVLSTSDHYSQFCILHSPSLKSRYHETKIGDYSRFSEENFISDISQTDWAGLISNASVDRCFSSFYNKLNKLVNKHAPLKTVSKCKAKQLSKLWISRGLHKSIKIKNDLVYSGDMATYKLYRKIMARIVFPNLSSFFRFLKAWLKITIWSMY